MHWTMRHWNSYITLKLVSIRETNKIGSGETYIERKLKANNAAVKIVQKLIILVQLQSIQPEVEKSFLIRCK